MADMEYRNGALCLDKLNFGDIEQYYIDNQEFSYVKIDSSNKILECEYKDGNRKIFQNVDIPYLENKIFQTSKEYTDDALEEIGEGIQVLTVLNSDKIGMIGDSYTDSSFAIKGKCYVAKMSLFSDYQFSNFAASGDIYAGRILAIRNKTARFGSVPFSDQKLKYVMMCCYTNDTKYLSVEEYLDSLRAAIKVVQSIGATPIVCTEYHTGTNPMATRIGLQQVAREFNLKYWNIAQITDIVNRSRVGGYTPFWGGSHAGTRTNALESDSYEFFLDELPRPQQSIKVFRARNDEYENINEYVFGNNVERAKLFKEIGVGEIALVNDASVDDCAEARTASVSSEYQALMRNTNVQMKKVNVISAILPIINKNLTYLSFEVQHTSPDLHVYIKDSFEPPYPTPVRYSSFYITFTNEPNAGDTYLCSEDNKTYTVQEHFVDDAGKYHLLCTPFVGSGYRTTGTLTKVTGSGDNEIHYTYREMGMNAASVTSDKGFNLVEIPINENDEYDLTNHIVGSVEVDKIDVYLVSDNNFYINDVKFKMKGTPKKIGDHEKELTFISNYYSDSTELLPKTHFAPTGETDDVYHLTSTPTYEEQHDYNVYPLGCSSKVDITDSSYINITITADKIKAAQSDLILELWCRYFPEIYTDGSGNQITEESYDYNDIIVDIEGQRSLSERVNTHWKICRFKLPTKINTALPLKIYSNHNGIELTYISLKYEN